MKPRLYWIIEELEEPRYDGATKVRWADTDDIEYLKRICAYMLDADTGDAKTNNIFFNTLYVWDINGDEIDKIPFIKFCKENNIISLRGKQPWVKEN